MKKYLLILVYFLFLTNVLQAQTLTKPAAKKIIDGLYKIKYISKKGKNVFYQLIDEPNLTRKRFLEIVEYKNKKGYYYKSPRQLEAEFPTFDLSRSGVLSLLIHDNFDKFLGRKYRIGLKSDVFAIRLTIFPENLTEINRLVSIGLIPKQVAQDLASQSENPDGFWEYIYQKCFLYENFDTLRQAQSDLLDYLKNQAFLSEENYLKVKQSYQADEIKTNNEIFSKCQNIVQVTKDEILKIKQDTTDDKALKYNELIFNKVKRLISDFNFSEIKFPDEQSTDLVWQYLSLKINGIEYQQWINDFPSLDESHADAYFLHHPFCLNAVNDFLRDKNDARRFYIIHPMFYQDVVSDRVQKILLDTIQRNTLEKYGLPISTFNHYLHNTRTWNHNLINEKNKQDYLELYDKKLHRDSLKAKIGEYQKIGITPQMTDIEIDSIIAKSIRHRGGLLRYLPNTTTNAKGWNEKYFFLNYYDNQNSFTEILQDLVDLSQGNFKPTDVYFQSSKRKLMHGFSFKDKKYSLAFGDTHLLMKTINQALQENQINGKFYRLYYDWIFLTPAQFDYFRQNESEIFKNLKD